MTIPASSIFGSSVTFNETNPSDKIVEIHINDFQDVVNGGDITDGVGIDDPTTWTASNFDTRASSLLSGILIRHLQAQPVANNDETNGSIVTFSNSSDKAFVVRNSIGQIRYRYRVEIYTDDSVQALDPDNVVGS